MRNYILILAFAKKSGGGLIFPIEVTPIFFIRHVTKNVDLKK